MQSKPVIQPAVNPYLLLTIGVVAVSFSALLVRMTDAAPAIIAFYRLLFTCVLLAPLAIRNRAEFKMINAKDLWLCGLSGLFLSFHFVFWFASLGWTSVSSAALMVNIHPLIVVTAGWVFMGERFKHTALPWAGVALAGMAVLSWGDLQVTGSAITGNLYAASGALMIAGYYLIGRQVRSRVGLSVYSILVYGTSMTLLFIYNIAVANPLAGYASIDWLAFVALAVIPTLFGHTFLNWSLKFLPAGAVSVSVLGEPVIASLLAIPLLKEVPGSLQLAGGIMVIGGIWMFLRRR